MISTVSNRGLLRFMLYDGGLDVARFITFLRRLLKDARQKVFLIVDNLKVHDANKVKAWVHHHRHEIELFYLPAYAPEHNPDEYLNHDLKQQLRRRPELGSNDELAQTRAAALCCARSSAAPRASADISRPPPVQYAA